jgi:hypothetical protein
LLHRTPAAGSPLRLSSALRISYVLRRFATETQKSHDKQVKAPYWIDPNKRHFAKKFT